MYKEKLKQFCLSLYSFGTTLHSWARQNFIWLLLVIPVLFTALMFLISDTNIFGWQDTNLCKNNMEIIHPAFLAIAVLLAAGGWLKTKDFAISCLFFLCAGALSREIIGQGSSFIFIITILVVIVCIEQNRERAATLLKSRLSTSFLAITFICYIFSQLLDRGVIKRFGWLVTWDTSWNVPYTSNIEESLESLGGLFLVFTVISLIVFATNKCSKNEIEN